MANISMKFATDQVKGGGRRKKKLTRQLINTRVAMIDCHHKENLKRNKSPGRENRDRMKKKKTEKFAVTTKKKTEEEKDPNKN
jgi:hypothetical protein